VLRSLLRTLLRAPRSLLDWLCAGQPDYRAFRRRRMGRGYRRRKSICVWLWIGAGLVMALNPSIQFVSAVGLGTAFLSFAILDGG